MAVEVGIVYMSSDMKNTLFQQAKKKLGKVRDLKQSIILRMYGRQLDQRMLDCADMIDRLDKDGWMLRYFGDRAVAQHEDIRTMKQANVRIQALGIDPKAITICTTWNDWFENPILEAT